jgi:hypothetical protein
MPPAKKPPSKAASSAKTNGFAEPASLKWLTHSLEAANQALAELRAHTGRDASAGARSLYTDLKSFVANARRDTGKLTKALQRDFEQAQKQVAAKVPTARKASGRKASSATKASSGTKASATSRASAASKAPAAAAKKPATATRSRAARPAAKRRTTKAS